MGEQEEHGRAHPVEVGGERGPAQELLGGHEAEGADHRGSSHRAGAGRFGRGPEVDEKDGPLLVADDVSRLDVAVEDRGLEPLQIDQRLEQIGRHRRHVRLAGAPAALHQLEQRGPRHQRPHQVAARHAVLGGGHEVDQRRDARVIEVGDGPRFALEQLELFPVAQAAHVKLLDGQASAIGRALGLVGDPATSLAQRAEHAVSSRDEIARSVRLDHVALLWRPTSAHRHTGPGLYLLRRRTGHPAQLRENSRLVALQRGIKRPADALVLVGPAGFRVASRPHAPAGFHGPRSKRPRRR